MTLCATCKSIDYRSLYIACLQQCRDRQANPEDYDASNNSLRVKHHDDIFEVEKSCGDCNLCKVIFQAFEKRNVTDVEDARGLPIVFRAFGNKIEVCFDTKERLIKLCGLDVYMNEVDVNKVFQLCNLKEDYSPPILKTIEKDPCSKASLAIAFGWLRNCLKNHDSCKPPTEIQKPPKRLINVGIETQNPFLVETSPSQQLKWLSLSYCWGGKPSKKLTTDTMNELMEGIPLNEFDPTIRDAILVTRALEIPYIWIDALCIIQDHEAKEWSEQASKMDEIYGGSTVTLVVASSMTVMAGFLTERELQYIPILRDIDPAGDSLAKVFILPEWDENEDELSGPWSRRGWTMQEGLLPSRLLHYTSSQMIWKCGEELRFEKGKTKSLQDEVSDDISFGSGLLWELDIFMKFKRFPDYLPRSLDYPLLSEPETFRLWYELIEKYTPREFANISDRLLAISGLAKIFGNTIRSHEYVAGLWKPDLIRGLIWHRHGAKLIPRFGYNPPDSNPFPSWSWASVGYEVVKNSRKNSNSFQALSLVKDVQVNLLDQHDPFSAVKCGSSVTITGPLKKVPRLYNKGWKSAKASISKIERHLSEIVENESLGDVKHRYSFPPRGHFAVLQMLKDIDSLDLLVLEATGKFPGGITEYRRVGVLTLRYFDKADIASPDLTASLKEFETSLAARLGPREKKLREEKSSNDVVMELRREPWKTETVIIV